MIEHPIVRRLSDELTKKYKEDNGWLFCNNFQKWGLALNSELLPKF